MAAAETSARYKEFAKALVAAMERSGVKPKDVWTELKVDQETVRLWMRGKRMPGDARLKRLAKMIGVEASVLRYGEAVKPAMLSHMKGMTLTDEDEIRLIQAYRGLDREWAKQALRHRAVELLEEFGAKGVTNPWAHTPGTQ